MEVFAFALIIAVISTAPWVRSTNLATVVAFFANFVIASFMIWSALPSTAGPLFGGFGFIAVFLFAANGFVRWLTSMGNDGPVPLVAGGAVLVTWAVIAFVNSTVFRAADYAALVGRIEVREWSQDFQPKSPEHMRTSSIENAIAMAGRASGQATTVLADGQQMTMSQFRVHNDVASPQLIKKQLKTIVPIDWAGFPSWTSSTPRGVGGYIEVDGENPLLPARYVAMPQGAELIYTPGAYWHQNLDRLVWRAHKDMRIADKHLEIDESGKPYYVVSMAVPTIGWGGEKVVGSVIVDPTTGAGANTFYPLGQEPDWVDRVMSEEIVHTNIGYHGQYASGWLNTAWSSSNMAQVTETHFGFGSDGQPVLATGITSHSANDEGTKNDSLIAMYYTNTRTGKTTEYRLAGGATEATCVRQAELLTDVVQARLHGTTPQLYNVLGHKVFVIPVQNATHFFEGVAICDITNVQVIAWGKTPYDAFLAFKQKLSVSGGHVGIEAGHKTVTVSGIVERFATEVASGTSVYHLTIQDVPHAFTGASRLSPKLPLTQVGDQVTIGYPDSGEDEMPMTTFDNKDVRFNTSPVQDAVRQKAPPK